MKHLKYINFIIYVLFPALAFGFMCSGPPRPDLLPETPEEEPPSIEQLESDLKNPNPRLKSQALLELAKRNERKFIPFTRTLLGSETESILKGAAVLALGIWKDRPSLPRILEFLRPESGVDMGTVLEAIARMEDPKAGDRVAQLLNDQDSTLRLLAVDTLVRIDAKQSGGSILIAARENVDPDKAKTYAMALGKLHVKESENYLLNLAEHSSPGPTLAAAYLALGKIRSKKAIPVLVDALQGNFEKGRENSVLALVEIKDPNCIPVVLPLLEHADREVRYRAADVLIGVPNSVTASKLRKVLKEGFLFARAPASHVLGRLKHGPAREEMETVLLNTNVPDREIVAQALGYLGDKRSLPVLIKILKEDNGEAKYGAVWALGAIGSEEALPAVEEAAVSQDQKLARIASESLGMIASPKSLDLLDKKTKEFPDLAPITLAAVASIPGEESRKILEKYANGKIWNVHQIAVSQLGAKKDPASIPALIFLLEDDSIPRNRKLVMAALRSVTGLKFASKNEWLNWFKKKKLSEKSEP